jgi:single-stranded-DNA-specific exonuclease
LLKANEAPNVGIKALKELSGMTGKVNINNLVFMIAPRVNAAGRMDDAKKAVSMFVAPSEEIAREYAEMLHSDNFERKEADKLITEEALAAIEANPDWIGRKSTLVYQPNWHKGVVGIVASRLIDHYYRPTIVLTKSGDVVSGSARSVPGFNLYEAIHACREHLIGYGGHFAAAGMTLKEEQVELFREKFEKTVAASILPDQLIPEIVIDAEIKFKEINQGLYGLLDLMEPFGPENQRPIFIAYDVTDSGYSKIVKENHIKFSLKQDGVIYTGIGFNMASKFNWIKSGQLLDVVFTIEENEWNGNKNLQLKVIDIRLAPAKN